MRRRYGLPILIALFVFLCDLASASDGPSWSRNSLFSLSKVSSTGRAGGPHAQNAARVEAFALSKLTSLDSQDDDEPPKRAISKETFLSGISFLMGEYLTGFR